MSPTQLPTVLTVSPTRLPTVLTILPTQSPSIDASDLCLNNCYGSNPNIYGPCLDMSSTPYICQAMNSQGNCPINTINCILFSAKQNNNINNNNEIKSIVKKENIFENSINDSIKLIIGINAILFLIVFICLLCIVLILINYYNNNSTKKNGFSKISQTDMESTTAVDVN